MSKWFVGALAAVILIAGAALLWELSSDPEPAATGVSPTPAASPVAQTTQPTPQPKPRPTPRRPPPRRPDPTDSVPSPPTSPATTPRKILAPTLYSDIAQRIYSAAASCYNGEEGRSDGFEIEYRLLIQNGVVSLHDAALVQTAIDAPGMIQCAMDAIDKLTWTESDAPDMDTRRTQKLTVLGLRKRASK